MPQEMACIGPGSQGADSQVKVDDEELTVSCDPHVHPNGPQPAREGHGSTTGHSGGGGRR